MLNWKNTTLLTALLTAPDGRSPRRLAAERLSCLLERKDNTPARGRGQYQLVPFGPFLSSLLYPFDRVLLVYRSLISASQP
ncbi:hypothetical protein VTN00DRAFT_473 [Thermoascus crustaceus]|uniref:uncharacterized protein n=1 Tax=Thermoascus crustaceus TaxID=5088 RepID=UPI0037444896